MKKILLLVILILPLIFAQAEDNDVQDPLTLYEGLIILSIVVTGILTWRTYFLILPKLKDKSYFEQWKAQLAVGLAIFGLKKFKDEKIQKSIRWVRLSFVMFILIVIFYILSIYYGYDLSR